jgi:hypothetical protein
MILLLSWWNHRLGFTLLWALALTCSFLLSPVTSSLSDRYTADAISYVPMGLSLFLAFVFCSFTESDRKGRFEGYPARLFTLPVSTGILITAPVIFGVGVVLTVYAIWASVVLPTTGRHLPLAWPCAYLASGMVCYQSILWLLARFRIARLLVLGIGGTIFSTSWILFREDFEQDVTTGLVPDGLSPRAVLYLVLTALTTVALIAAFWAVESDRRGGSREWQGWRKLIETAMDWMPGRIWRFQSAGQAQFWYEWRRHGLVFPLGTAGVLLVIMLPAAFWGPLPEGWTVLCLQGILFTPLLLAFTLGKGFGKADMWSKSLALPLFLATRPLKNTEYIAAKMKAAALAVISAWAVVMILTPLWLGLCCETRMVDQMLLHAASIYPGIGFYGAIAVFAGVGVVITWRFLIGGLYLGLTGKYWMLSLSGVGVFVVFFGSIFLLAALSSNPAVMVKNMPGSPAVWLWILTTFLVLKVATAFLFAVSALRRGLVTFRAVLRYFALWFVITMALASAAWYSAIEDGTLRSVLICLAFLVVPLLRVSCAPIALAWGQRR